jgi:rhodanese-related sulfurtransferase
VANFYHYYEPQRRRDIHSQLRYNPAPLQDSQPKFLQNPMFLEFAIQNWYLFAMLAVILLLLAFDPSNKMAGGASKISATQLPQIQARKSAVVVDVRTEDEFKKGHIEQSINLPLDGLEGNLKKLNKYRGKPVILICQSGTRTAKAAGILKKNEFGELYALEGGIASWSKENLPLARS